MRRAKAEPGTPVGDSRGRRFVAAVAAALLSVLAVLAAGCEVEGVGGDGDADDAPYDASAVDVSAEECALRTDQVSCDRKRGCYWLAATCEDGRVVASCVPASADPNAALTCDRDAGSGGDTGPEPPSDTCEGVDDGCAARDAADGGSDAWVDGGDAGGDTGADAADAGDAAEMVCSTYGDPTACRSDVNCEWWRGMCGGQVVREKCIATDSTTPEVECRTIPPGDCHERTSESGCPPRSCTWVEQGCGGGSGNTLQLEACLPDGRCSRDADCPNDHSCKTLWLDPCANSSCTACGRSADRCVPNDLLSP